MPGPLRTSKGCSRALHVLAGVRTESNERTDPDPAGDGRPSTGANGMLKETMAEQSTTGRVLVVDDEPTIIHVLTELLEEKGLIR